MNCRTDSIATRPAAAAGGASDTMERRLWVRFVLPELVTRVSWRFGGQSESHLVSLVKVDGVCAVVIMEHEPPGNQAYMIHFDNGRTGAVPIPARLSHTEATEYGRTLATFHFDLADSRADGLPQDRERRAWRREAPRECSASLSWMSGDSTMAIDAKLEDIGGGGAAVKVADRPPINETLRLWVGRKGQEAGPVECRMVGCESSSDENFLVRLAFVGLCPMDVFVVAMGLDISG